MHHRWDFRCDRRIGCAGAVVIISLLLGGCEDALSTEQPAPILVTLPAVTSLPATAAPTDLPTEASPEGTLASTQSVPPTPIPESSGIGSTHRLWEWDIVARPSALAASSSRLAVIITDGRFAWLNAETGQIESAAFLWSGILQGESWGEVYVDGLGTFAVAAVHEQSINSQTGIADSRSRLVVYDAQASELWSLPELEEPYHLYTAALTSISVIVGKWPRGFRNNSLAAYELYTGEELWEVSEPNTGYRQIVHDGNRVYVLLDNDEGGAVAAFDLRTGDEIWRWTHPEMVQPDMILLGPTGLYVVTVSRTAALDPGSGQLQWMANITIAPEARIASHSNYVYVAPAAGGEYGRKPGIMGFFADGSGLAWHSLSGLLAEPIVAGEEALWVVLKDHDAGTVALSGLEPDTGLERIRLDIGFEPNAQYHLVVHGRQIYVLGNSLLAFGY